MHYDGSVLTISEDGVSIPMNYFAHGLRFLNRPYFLAGTAVPDWLSVADRATRMHSKRVFRFLDEAEGIDREIAAVRKLDDVAAARRQRSDNFLRDIGVSVIEQRDHAVL